ncbi:MAG: hypothetical protein NZT92_19965 [Abditibacteriales bacterium]|nr:hypothetical protein [Abditibacteriales bacterium]MDW8368009.1 hypothetical protein [Abditibacteriales bacterium]
MTTASVMARSASDEASPSAVAVACAGDCFAALAMTAGGGGRRGVTAEGLRCALLAAINRLPTNPA